MDEKDFNLLALVLFDIWVFVACVLWYVIRSCMKSPKKADDNCEGTEPCKSKSLKNLHEADMNSSNVGTLRSTNTDIAKQPEPDQPNDNRATSGEEFPVNGTSSNNNKRNTIAITEFSEQSQSDQVDDHIGQTIPIENESPMNKTLRPVSHQPILRSDLKTPVLQNHEEHADEQSIGTPQNNNGQSNELLDEHEQKTNNSNVILKPNEQPQIETPPTTNRHRRTIPQNRKIKDYKTLGWIQHWKNEQLIKWIVPPRSTRVCTVGFDSTIPFCQRCRNRQFEEVFVGLNIRVCSRCAELIAPRCDICRARPAEEFFVTANMKTCSQCAPIAQAEIDRTRRTF